MREVALMTSAAACGVWAYVFATRLEVCGIEGGWRVEWLFGSWDWQHVGEVTSLYVYPVKSCRGCEVDAMELDVYGASLDRRFMVVDENNRFVTQRQEAVMCRIRAEILPDGEMSLSLPGRGITSQCCFKPATTASEKNPEVTVCIWDDDVVAIDQGKEVAGWLSTVMGRPARLVGMSTSFDRPTSRKYTPETVPGQTAFSDGFPLLLISENSLHDLNSRLSTPLPMNRFRPNLVVSGCGAYAEDTWRKLFIGGTHFQVVKPCSRCKITTTDQETGYRGEEPLRTLSTYRLKQHVKAPCGDAVDVFFGQNICHEGPGEVTTGDMVFARYWKYPWFMRSFSHFYEQVFCF